MLPYELEDLAKFIESLNQRGRSRADASTKQRLTKAHVKKGGHQQIIDYSNHHMLSLSFLFYFTLLLPTFEQSRKTTLLDKLTLPVFI